MTGPADVWASFGHDPRLPQNAGLRAADADREVVRQLLVEAYADGRLDRDELDARTTTLGAARTLGDLPALLDGLVATSSVPAVLPGGALSPLELHQQAVASWRATIRSEIGRFLTASLICWTIWFVTGMGFAWPVFVSLGTAVPILNSLIQRTEIIDSRRARLEKKQRKALEQPHPEDDE